LSGEGSFDPAKPLACPCIQLAERLAGRPGRISRLCARRPQRCLSPTGLSDDYAFRSRLWATAISSGKSDLHVLPREIPLSTPPWWRCARCGN
jgi:hypothetical protein